MANYFNFFPKTAYYKNKDSTSLDIITNITVRYNFSSDLKKNSAAYYKYKIKDGDTPENLAFKIYGSSEKHWIILTMNDIVDPIYEWPLSQRSIAKFIETKYSSPSFSDTANTAVSGTSWAKNNTQAYYKIETRTNLSNGLFKKSTITVDANTYNNVTTSTTNYTLTDGTPLRVEVSKETENYYDYETQLNENKREIIILKPEFSKDVDEEFKRIMGDTL